MKLENWGKKFLDKKSFKNSKYGIRWAVLSIGVSRGVILHNRTSKRKLLRLALIWKELMWMDIMAVVEYMRPQNMLTKGTQKRKILYINHQGNLIWIITLCIELKRDLLIKLGNKTLIDWKCFRNMKKARLTRRIWHTSDTLSLMRKLCKTDSRNLMLLYTEFWILILKGTNTE